MNLIPKMNASAAFLGGSAAPFWGRQRCLFKEAQRQRRPRAAVASAVERRVRQRRSAGRGDRHSAPHRTDRTQRTARIAHRAPRASRTARTPHTAHSASCTAHRAPCTQRTASDRGARQDVATDTTLRRSVISTVSLHSSLTHAASPLCTTSSEGLSLYLWTVSNADQKLFCMLCLDISYHTNLFCPMRSSLQMCSFDWHP